MAKFTVKIEMDDLSLVDDVSAIFPDEAIAPMIAASEQLGYVDSTGYLIKGGRAVTYAVRAYLTGLVKEYANRVASAAAVEQARQQVDGMLSNIVIEDNVPAPEPTPDPVPE